MKKFDEFLDEAAKFDGARLKIMFHDRMDFLEVSLQKRLSDFFNKFPMTQKDSEDLVDIVEDIYNAGIEFESKPGFPHSNGAKARKVVDDRDK